MNEILFLLFAFFTVFLSIRLSYYIDYLNKTYKISGVFLGGIVLAGVTSLPEFVTCFSAIFVNNYSLAVGDILGSNIFNIFMICFFDLVFIKKMLFSKTSASHNLVFFSLIINYVVLYLYVTFFSSFNSSFLGIPTLFIVITYVFYLFKISKSNLDAVKINDYSYKHVSISMFITIVFMIFSSVILTIIVNKLSVLHPAFSSSFFGAIFLGITTSLPEVITCYSLISLNNYDLALSDIIGSNFFNLLILALGDLFSRGSIYYVSDNGVFVLVIFGLIFTVLCFINNRKNNSFLYGFLSFLIVCLYFCYWFFNFFK